ncbi:hypothetical protein AOQ84DRAFT_166295 [Glonium stellatum]|uniref:Uncharacterized protein n=1 Tax=Glonium stellatum TaxID=574774 RepID=A0A8E2EQQ0_9PEZI|nr:hypothetical protein AOQ84DRAFT_166295 [Glonium stellatum]
MLTTTPICWTFLLGLFRRVQISPPFPQSGSHAVRRGWAVRRRDLGSRLALPAMRSKHSPFLFPCLAPRRKKSAFAGKSLHALPMTSAGKASARALPSAVAVTDAYFDFLFLFYFLPSLYYVLLFSGPFLLTCHQSGRLPQGSCHTLLFPPIAVLHGIGRGNRVGYDGPSKGRRGWSSCPMSTVSRVHCTHIGRGCLVKRHERKPRVPCRTGAV